MKTPDAARKLGFSWCWAFDHSWGVWFDRGNAPPQIAWRFNIGPLHVVMLR